MKNKRINIQTIRKMETLLAVCADQTRLKIMLSLLNNSECTCECGCGETRCCGKCKLLTCMIKKSVSEIVDSIGCSQSLVSHQLKVLRDNDIVKVQKDGLKSYYSLKDGHIKELLDLVLEHVEER